jgi:hypothetical protein
MLKWLNQINKIKMLILIVKLSKFSIITFYLFENLSLNTQESTLPSPPSILESIFHQRRFSRLLYLPIQPSLASSVYHHESFAAPMFLIPAFACNPIRNVCKASSSRLICYLGSILRPNLFFFSFCR